MPDDALTCRVVVVNLLTKRVWSLLNRPGSLFLDILALSDNEVLLTEIDWPSSPRHPQETQRLVRIALDRLDALEQVW